jgi:hypothetical protein
MPQKVCARGSLPSTTPKTAGKRTTSGPLATTNLWPGEMDDFDPDDFEDDGTEDLPGVEKRGALVRIKNQI